MHGVAIESDPLDGAAPRAPTGSLRRGLTVLRLVAEHGSVRVDRIAKELDLPVSSVYRYLQPLREFGLIVDDGANYKPGPVVSGLSWCGLSKSELVSLATPVMSELRHETEESVALLVRVGSYAFCIHQVESHHHLRLDLPIGEPLPLYGGAASRTLLAFAPDEIVQHVLTSDFELFTPNTPGSSALAVRLESTRQSRVTTSRGELSPGCFAIAVPVFASGVIFCALSVAGPESRCNPAWQVHAKSRLRAAGEALSRLLDQVPAEKPSALLA